METHRDFVMKEFDKFLGERMFTEKQMLIDVGCRDTSLKEEFENRNCSWMGCDIVPGDEVLPGKMEDLFFVPSNAADIVFCCHAFEHCTRPIDALKEFKRILKPNGWLFIATPYPNQHHILLKDPDHIFCLNNMQMTRLLVYTQFKGNSYVQADHTTNENDWNIITIGQKI